MQHIIVLPMSDPRGGLFPLFQKNLPDLKTVFTRACLGVESGRQGPEDPFTYQVEIPPGLPVGEQFRQLYEGAARAFSPDAVLHLCFIDRVAYALQPAYRETFLADLAAISGDDLPLLYLRSAAAWETHPANYREIEGMATQLGRWVLGKSLDFAWCHLVIRAGQLAAAVRDADQPDLSMMAQVLLHIQAGVKTKEVDWLAWEDAFLLGRDPAELRREREESREETRKRLSYILPTLDMLCERGMGYLARLQAEEAVLSPLPREEE